jgi:hypothetical protein
MITRAEKLKGDVQALFRTCDSTTTRMLLVDILSNNLGYITTSKRRSMPLYEISLRVDLVARPASMRLLFGFACSGSMDTGYLQVPA